MTTAIWHQRPTLTDLQAMSRATAIEHLGIEFTEVGDDYLAGRMPVDRRTIQDRVLKRGQELLMGPVPHLQHIARVDAVRIERDLAIALADAGLLVEGGH